jgi:DNA-binding NarL/FixJ family response regulator
MERKMPKVKYDSTVNFDSFETNELLKEEASETIKRRSKHLFVLVETDRITLSNREFQCLELLAHGKRIKEIARDLQLSPRTIEDYMETLKEKTRGYVRGSLADFYWQQRIKDLWNMG